MSEQVIDLQPGESPVAKAFRQWAILEIMGHQKFAGLVTEETIAGGAMLRIDVPQLGELMGFTRYFSAASVYAITPCSEQLARDVAEGLRKQPISVYDLPESLREKLRSRPGIYHRELSESDTDHDYVDTNDFDDSDEPY